jgi:maltooligosyltrehalose trehalohydrolase
MRPRVWAPVAITVELVLGEERRPMTQEGDGWWTADGDLEHGRDYAFTIDSSVPMPDPRSAWQPAGVHGPSRVFDAARHVWRDTGWAGIDVRGAVIYELHIGTFTTEGTLAAATQQLDHLVQLGIDVVELLPVAAFNGVHGWGYDGVGLYSVHEPYGGPAALQDFVDAAHALGLAVCLDVVHNHLGPSGNYLDAFGPYFTLTHKTPWGAAINLDAPGSREVRRWICDSALRWFRDFHVDALRLDAVHALVDSSTQHILAQLSDEVAALAGQLRRPLSLIAESDLNDPVSATPTSAGGWGMTAQWADDVHHAIHTLVTGERHGYYVDFGTPEVLCTALTEVFVHAGTFSTFRDRLWGQSVPRDTDGHRFVVFASDHDQVGNRGLGDRPSATLDLGALAIEAALILLSPFTPMIFMGEEWGARTPWMYFSDHPEPELAQAVREGRREEFGRHGWAALYGEGFEVPDPQGLATFRASRLNWTELTQPVHMQLLDWYRQLIRLRRSNPDIACGDLQATTVGFEESRQPTAGAAPWEGWLVLGRGRTMIVVNLAHTQRRVPLQHAGPYTVQAAWTPVVIKSVSSAEVVAHVVMPGRSVAVLVPDA